MYLKRRSSSGFALAEMIISLAAVTLAIALVAGLGQQVMQLARSSKQTAAVVELRSKTTAITRNLESWIGKLRSSPHTGATFSACIPDPSTPVSVFNCPDVSADLLNNDSELKRIAGTQLHAASVNVVDMMGEKLAGTLDAPVLYDLEGRICTSNCALKATGFMLRSNPASDSTPGSVKFVVKVEPHTRVSGQSPIRTSYLSIDVGSEWQQPTGFCPSGSIKVGYLTNGKPSCINPTKKCATNTVHLGLDGSGNPICKTPPASCATAGGSVVINADGTDLVCATNMSAIPCQSNEIFLGYYAGTGVPMCSSTNLSCPDGQVQIGIAQEGASLTAQCKTLPSCQDSQKLSYDGSQFECVSASIASTCNPDEVVVGINEDGSAKCEVQERNLASTELTCPTGKYVSGLEPSGKVICSDLPTNSSSASSTEIVNSSTEIEVSLDGTEEFEAGCQHSVQIRVSDQANINYMNADTSWRVATLKSQKYLGFIYTGGSGIVDAVWGIPHTNKRQYGYRDSNGTFTHVSGVTILKIKKICSQVVQAQQPSDMTLVNNSFYISNKKMEPALKAQAIAVCNSLGARLCELSEWTTACQALPEYFQFKIGKVERNMTDGQCRGGNANGDCTSWNYGSNCNINTEPEPFRCCLTK